jgi:hypothetical protein
MLKVGLPYDYGSSAFVCLVPILLKNSVRSGLKCIVPQDVEAMVATNYQS